MKDDVTETFVIPTVITVVCLMMIFTILFVAFG
jgi:hypothetical protein